jgi:hypothetical protein
MTHTPGIDCDSMCSRFETVVVATLSLRVVIRSAISVADIPVYDQIIETTGMSMSGKMSVGVRVIVVTPNRSIMSAMTINVYLCRKASLTIHIMSL